jgi:membrane-bound lytic murein transglycosylase B
MVFTKRHTPRWLLLLAFGVLLLGGGLSRAADQASWAGLEKRLEKDGFNRTSLDKIFSNEDLVFNPTFLARKMNALLRIKMGASAPAPKHKAAVQPEVLPNFLTPESLDKARRYMAQHPDLLDSIRDKYGIPPEVMTAFLLVETHFGTNVGGRSALATLASMAAVTSYRTIEPYIKPPRPLTSALKKYMKKRTLQKANWAYEELKALLNYAQMLNIPPGDIPGSPYGAIGICQFMPTSALAYGADGDGDGDVDLFTKLDAVHSMANFLKKNGWRPGLSRKRQLKVVYRYNHSWVYANTIMAVADKLTEQKEQNQK